jgi:hypothetical protein
MKLQKRFSRKYNQKDYYKYVVNVPALMIKEAGILEGEELEIEAKEGKIILKKKKKY